MDVFGEAFGRSNSEHELIAFSGPAFNLKVAIGGYDGGAGVPRRYGVLPQHRRERVAIWILDGEQSERIGPSLYCRIKAWLRLDRASSGPKLDRTGPGAKRERRNATSDDKGSRY
jgi:hypothetical protein